MKSWRLSCTHMQKDSRVQFESLTVDTVSDISLAAGDESLSSLNPAFCCDTDKLPGVLGILWYSVISLAAGDESLSSLNPVFCCDTGRLPGVPGILGYSDISLTAGMQGLSVAVTREEPNASSQEHCKELKDLWLHDKKLFPPVASGLSSSVVSCTAYGISADQRLLSAVAEFRCMTVFSSLIHSLNF